MKHTIAWCLALALIVCLPAVMLGQAVDSQQISGTVTDPTGAAVPNATITVTNEATRQVHTVQSNGSGNYVALDLPVGTYTVSTSVPGFKKSVISAVNVDVGSKPAVDVVLAIGQVSETVEVSASSVMIQTTTSESGGIITSQEATEIQLNGRNYVQLLTLQPGVSSTIASGFALFGTFGVSGSSQSVNGIRTDSANYFVDGVDNKDNGGGGNNFVNISPDSLQQFHNAASGYDASYGGSSGTTVSVAIKSGGRSFHGSAYEYIRNNDIQGFQFKALSVAPGAPFPKAPLHYNDFGYTLGGPIWIPGVFNRNRDKLFFFVGEEWKRLRNSTQTNITLPTTAGIAAAEAGPTTASGRALASTLLLAPCATPCSATTGTYSYLSLANNNQAEYLVKIDYNLNQKNQINGHFVHDNTLNIGNPTGYIIYNRTIPGLTSSLQWTHIFNSKSVNTAVGSYSGNIINEGGSIRSNPQFGSPSILRSSYPGLPNTLFGASQFIPQISISALIQNPAANPRAFDNSQRIYALKDDFSLVMGNHSLRTGAYFWRARKNQTAPPALNSQITSATLAALVDGNFTTYTEGGNIPQIQARFSQFETYLQDDWTVSHRLTLNLGLRWQYMPFIASWPNNTAFFDPRFYDPTQAATFNSTGGIATDPLPFNGLVLPGTGFSAKAKQVVAPSVYNNPQVLALFHNLPAGLINPVYNTFAPRVGFAYDLTGKGTTVLRGGYGMSYERVEGNYIYGAANQLPFVANISLSGGNVDALGTPATATNTIGNSADRNLTPPRIHNYNLGLQHKLFSNTSVELSYVGSRSSNLTWLKDLNQGAAGTEQATPSCLAFRNTCRQYKGYAEINQYTNGAHSNYNSLQAHWQSQFSKGGLVNISYTWSQCLSMGSAYNYAPQDSNNLAADYGPCSYNQPQILSVSYVYPLPFWQHEHTWYKQALGGWQVSGVTRVASGLPINVTQVGSASTAGDLVTSATVAQRPNLVGNPYAHGGKQYLNPAAFQTPALGTFGNLHYDGVKGPLFDNWDATLQKNFTIHDAVGLEFRAEMFNVPNHMSFFTVAGGLGVSTFGQVTAATDPRTMEFALRLHF